MTSVLEASLIVNIDIVIPVATPYPPAHMSQPPIFAFENLALQQGGGWLFQDIDLFIGARDRLALIGRNGAGKTTLMKLVAGSVEADKGTRVVVPGTNIVMLEQDPDVTSFDRLVDFAIHGEKGPPEYAVRAIADQLGINLDREAKTASGGEKRRAAICRALASEPDLLLLDEPTNHLDLAAIEWLEDWLTRYRGAFMVISHDRTFLTRLTRQTFWLDRGLLRRNEIGFGGYDAWTERVYAEDARNADRLDAKLKIEAHWLERGVTARRKRNQGRLAKLWEMRAARAAMIGPQGTAKLAAASDDSKTKTVISAEGIGKSFGDRTIIKDFTLRIQRGDRIGIVGANGTGKTTTCAKLAKRMAERGEPAILAACDTFRAAAIEQLQLWGSRLEIPVIAGAYQADPAAVAHVAVVAAQARNARWLFIDTAGRLHTKHNLMQELQKVHRVVDRKLPGAPHEVLLVLDGSTGMNAMVQAREFHKLVKLTGLVITKLDGTSKGGAVVAIQRELGIPVKFIGVGEQAADLQAFNAREFAEALFSAKG